MCSFILGSARLLTSLTNQDKQHYAAGFASLADTGEAGVAGTGVAGAASEVTIVPASMVEPQELQPVLTGAETVCPQPQLGAAGAAQPQLGAAGAAHPQLGAGASQPQLGAGAGQQVGAGAGQQVGAGALQDDLRLLSFAKRPTRLLPPQAGAGSQQVGAGAGQHAGAGAGSQQVAAEALQEDLREVNFERRPLRPPPQVGAGSQQVGAGAGAQAGAGSQHAGAPPQEDPPRSLESKPAAETGAHVPVRTAAASATEANRTLIIRNFLPRET